MKQNSKIEAYDMDIDENSDDIIELSSEEDGERIDKYLSETLTDYSRSYLKNLIDEGRVQVAGKIVKGSFKVYNGAAITVNLPPVKDVKILPEDIPLDILYEDEDVILVNKPKGMVVHPAAGHYTGTLVNALMFHCRDNLSGINGELRPGIVHRIDMDTTGVVIACKNDAAHRFVAEQLKEHSIKRKYQAIVYGAFKENEGRIEGAIGRSKTDRKKMAIVPNGKPAVTHYKVLKNFSSPNGNNYAHIECELETGRTHQIRVHMAHIGHPLLGDWLYKGPCDIFDKRQALHSYYFECDHPVTKTRLKIKTNMPADIKELISKLESEL